MKTCDLKGTECKQRRISFVQKFIYKPIAGGFKLVWLFGNHSSAFLIFTHTERERESKRMRANVCLFMSFFFRLRRNIFFIILRIKVHLISCDSHLNLTAIANRLDDYIEQHIETVNHRETHSLYQHINPFGAKHTDPFRFVVKLKYMATFLLQLDKRCAFNG